MRPEANEQPAKEGRKSLCLLLHLLTNEQLAQVLSGALVHASAVRFLINLGQTGPILLFGTHFHLKFPNSIKNMMKTKKTLNWSRYYNYYGMTPKLYTAMWNEGWTVQAIKDYSISHAHEVNQDMATRYKGNPPDVPVADDKKWLKRHLPLKGSGKAPRKPLLPKQTKRKGSSKSTAPKPHRYRPGMVALCEIC